LKSKFESNQIKNIGVIHLNFFHNIVSAILYLFSGKNFFLKITKKCIFSLKFLSFLAPGSGFPIRIRIHKVSESGSNPDPDPQPCFRVLISGLGVVDLLKNPEVKNLVRLFIQDGGKYTIKVPVPK
jgi:hypothetical protein